MALSEPTAELDARAREVIGAAIDVHAHLGPGFLETIYENALCHELSLRRIPHVRQVPIVVGYKGLQVGRHRLDILVPPGLVIELKAIDALLPIHTAQVVSYLRATGHTVGLLINFDVRRMKDGIRRIIVSCSDCWPPRTPRAPSSRSPSD